MTLIVEDGSIVAGAESYISVLDANTYHTNRNNTAWAESETSAKEAALRKATDYMLQVYRMRWQGWKVDQNQPLDWPRNSVYVDQAMNYNNQITAHLVPDNIVPLEVKKACAEYALKALSEDLFADLERGVTSEKIDKIQVDYDKFSPQSKRYVAIDAMLMPFMGTSNTNYMRNLAR
jgi:hypothetical protein